MEIFGIGPGEMLLIGLLALMIVGPQKLPEMGRNLGRMIGEFKAQADAFRSVLTLDPPANGPDAAAAAAPPAIQDERVIALQAYTHRTPAARRRDTTPLDVSMLPTAMDEAQAS